MIESSGCGCWRRGKGSGDEETEDVTMAMTRATNKKRLFFFCIADIMCEWSVCKKMCFDQSDQLLGSDTLFLIRSERLLEDDGRKHTTNRRQSNSVKEEEKRWKG